LNKPVLPWHCGGWLKELAAYGFKAFPGGAFLEINSRVDIIILGIFQTDQVVGIYSLAALLVEGISLVTVALLVNINPIITATYFRNDRREFKAIITDTIKYSYIMMIILAVLSCAMYPFFIMIFMSPFMDSWPLFCILMAGLTASAGYFPLRILFSQTGHPGLQTLFFSLVLVSNITLNLALIPALGMYGAALATGIAYLLTSIYLKLIARYAMLLQI
jgi:O-antigen/teichoic acid export membrane protein